MAFLMTGYQLPSGLISEQAYVKVETVLGNKNKMQADIKVYISKEAADNGLMFIDQKSVSFVPDATDEGVNYHKQTYEYAKTLEEFRDAVDC